MRYEVIKEKWVKEEGDTQSLFRQLMLVEDMVLASRTSWCLFGHQNP